MILLSQKLFFVSPVLVLLQRVLHGNRLRKVWKTTSTTFMQSFADPHSPRLGRVCVLAPKTHNQNIICLIKLIQVNEGKWFFTWITPGKALLHLFAIQTHASTKGLLSDISSTSRPRKLNPHFSSIVFWYQSVIKLISGQFWSFESRRPNIFHVSWLPVSVFSKIFLSFFFGENFFYQPQIGPFFWLECWVCCESDRDEKERTCSFVFSMPSLSFSLLLTPPNGIFFNRPCVCVGA